MNSQVSTYVHMQHIHLFAIIHFMIFYSMYLYGFDRMKSTSARKMSRRRIKVEKKFTKMAKKGKLRKYAKDRVKMVREKRKEVVQERQAQIQWDWIIDRRHRRKEQERVDDDGSSDDVEENDHHHLPMDMLDPDFPLDANFYKMMLAKEGGWTGEGEAMDPEEWEEQIRTFVDEKELLPVKVGGKVIKRFEQEEEKPDIDAIKEEMEDEEAEEDGQNMLDLDLSKLNDDQLTAHYAKTLAEAESTVASAADQLIVDPRENVSKFGLLLKMAAGIELSTLVREPVQKLATASLAELFVNVLPSYTVHVLSETEKSQKMKKETKRLAAFEQSLLNYYIKYLKFMEKNATRLIHGQPDESAFSTQFGFLCARCLCQLAEKCTNFNYSLNIISCLIRLSLTKWQKLLNAVCASISAVFAADVQLRVSLHGVQGICTLVDKKKAYVPAQLISTLLSLNIKEIERKAKSKRKNVATNLSKKKRKFGKQIGKLEMELEEAVAADAHSAKLRNGTEVMRHIFLIYFRILRRMPQTALLRPVLEGLTKFMHLINVEFYDDLVAHLGRLVEQKQLKFSDTLHCVRTAAHILTGEGQAIDVDLQKFYRALFANIPSVCFQQPEETAKNIALLADALQLLLVRRRKAVSSAKAAAFAKRLALVAIPSSQPRCTIALLLILRRLLLAHSSLKSLIHGENDDEDSLVVTGQFRPDCSEPDYCNALTTTICDELQLLTTHTNTLVRTLAHHLLNGLPANGKHRLDARWANIEPREIFTAEDPLLGSMDEREAAPFYEALVKFCKLHKRAFCSENLCSTICLFLSDPIRGKR